MNYKKFFALMPFTILLLFTISVFILSCGGSNFAQNKDSHIIQLEKDKKELNNTINSLNTIISKRDSEIRQKNNTINNLLRDKKTLSENLRKTKEERNDYKSKLDRCLLGF